MGFFLLLIEVKNVLKSKDFIYWRCREITAAILSRRPDNSSTIKVHVHPLHVLRLRTSHSDGRICRNPIWVPAVCEYFASPLLHVLSLCKLTYGGYNALQFFTTATGCESCFVCINEGCIKKYIFIRSKVVVNCCVHPSVSLWSWNSW